MNLKIDMKETMMAYENIIFERDGDVAVIKFNRPKALNAINQAVGLVYSINTR